MKFLSIIMNSKLKYTYFVALLLVIGGLAQINHLYFGEKKNVAEAKQEVAGAQIGTTITTSPTPSVKAKYSPTPTKGKTNVTISPTSKPSNSNSNSGSNSNSPTPTSSPAPTTIPIATTNTDSVSITMNRGETKSNIFSFTSNGATSFIITLSLNPSIANINWNPFSGGISTGQITNFSISLPSSTTIGTYTGSIQLKFQPGNYIKTIPMTLTVIEPKSIDIGYTFSSDSINATIKKGTLSSDLLSFTSTGSTQFTFSGYPTNYGSGIGWWTQGGGSVPGATNTQRIEVNSDVPTGTYTGTGLFKDNTTGAEKSISITVNVTD